MGMTQKVRGGTTDKVRIFPSDQDRDFRTFTKNTHLSKFYKVFG